MPDLFDVNTITNSHLLAKLLKSMCLPVSVCHVCICCLSVHIHMLICCVFWYAFTRMCQIFVYLYGVVCVMCLHKMLIFGCLL